jgi:hypothetical protein
MTIAREHLQLLVSKAPGSATLRSDGPYSTSHLQEQPAGAAGSPQLHNPTVPSTPPPHLKNRTLFSLAIIDHSHAAALADQLVSTSHTQRPLLTDHSHAAALAHLSHDPARGDLSDVAALVDHLDAILQGLTLVHFSA